MRARFEERELVKLAWDLEGKVKDLPGNETAAYGLQELYSGQISGEAGSQLGESSALPVSLKLLRSPATWRTACRSRWRPVAPPGSCLEACAWRCTCSSS